MRIILSLTILSLISFSLYSQTELSEINDPDGFTNIREGKSSKTPVVAKVELGDFFYAEPSETESWWKVSTIAGLVGYMHKSRVRLIKDMDDDYRKEVIMIALDMRKRDEESVAKAEQSGDEELAHKKRANREQNVWNVYNPALSTFPDYFCENPDEAMVDLFFQTILVTQNSANEIPSYTLGEMYLCNPDFILKQIGTYEYDDEQTLVGALYWGFENVVYDMDPKPENVEDLKKRINGMIKN